MAAQKSPPSDLDVHDDFGQPIFADFFQTQFVIRNCFDFVIQLMDLIRDGFPATRSDQAVKR